MSSMSRSPLLPPYAMPPLEQADGAADVGADAAIVSSRRMPFVPPSFKGELLAAVTHEPESEASRVAFSQDVSHDASHDASADASQDASHTLSQNPNVDSARRESDDSDLPWIEEFGEAIPDFSETLSSDASEHNDDMALVDDDAGEVIAADSSAEASSDDAAETWAINEAGPSIAHIANELASASAPPAGVSPTVAPSPAAHTPWQDDEAWMDIMPTLPNTGSHDPAMDTSWARAFSDPMPPMTPPPLPTGDTQAAAASLEAIARQLRSGELCVPGFHAEAGDAAALAAALASLLGGRA